MTFPQKYCRLCATPLKSSVFIFGEEGTRLQIPEKIRKTLSILVLEEDTLPKKICTDCCSSLEDYAKYKDTVLDAQEKLMGIARGLERRVSNFQCGICKAPVSDREQLLAHHASEHESEEYPSPVYGCAFCAKISENYNYFRVHGHGHIGHKEHQDHGCKVCGKRFSTGVGLEGHVKEHESASGSSSDSPTCDIEIPEPEPLENPPEPIKCPHCDKVYQTQRGYDLHIKSHLGKRYQCPSCDASFSQKGSLSHHTTSKHTSLKQFKCEQCPKEFFTQKLLRRHERFHTEPNIESKCDVCDKVYKSKLHLKHHMKIHNSNKNYVCKYCDKRFQNQYKLNIHENTHTGNRPMKCPHCDYSARTQGPYYRHLKGHKGDLGNKVGQNPEPQVPFLSKSQNQPENRVSQIEPLPQAQIQAPLPPAHHHQKQDLVDCAMQAFSEELEPYNYSNHYHFQTEPMELSYKLQEMPMELTKVFQPLELRQEFSQLMDLSSRNYREERFEMPIDLRPEEPNSNLSQRTLNDQSTFLRELIDLSSSNGENLTKKQNYHEMFI